MSKKKVKVSITVIEGKDKGNSFDIVKKAVIGRTSGDIVIDDPKISRKHAEIIIQNGKVTIKDLGSTNGVIVNDVKVDESELSNLDEITLGFTKVSVRTEEKTLLNDQRNIPAVSQKTVKDDYAVYFSTDIGPTVSAIIAAVEAGDDTLIDLRVERPSLEERFLELTTPGEQA